MPQRLRRNLFDDEDDQQIVNPVAFDDDYADPESQVDTSPLDFPDDEEETDDDLANIQARPSAAKRFQDIFRAARDVPEGPANIRYRKFLEDEMPKREPPGKINRLAAVLGGASEGYFRGAGAGIRTAQETLEQPYERQLRDYSIKGRALEGAAALEDKSLGRAASFARTAGNLAAADARVEQQQADRQARVNNWNARNSNEADRINKIGIRSIVNQSTGELVFITPDGKKFNAGKVDATLGEKEKIKLNTFLNEESVRQKNRLALSDYDAANTQIGQNKNQAAIAAREAAGRADVTDRQSNTPQNVNYDIQNKMKKFLALNGESAKDYFEISPEGIPTALKPGDPNDERYKSIYNYLYGKRK